MHAIPFIIGFACAFYMYLLGYKPSEWEWWAGALTLDIVLMSLFLSLT